MAKLHFYYSAMNAGKSTVLLQSSHNYNERGMDTLLFVPSIDNRYGTGKVTTRLGLQKEAVALEAKQDVFQLVQMAVAKNSNIKCILVDEAHFLSKNQVHQLTYITDQLNIPVLAYGLRTDFQAEPFEGSLYLLALADQLIEIKTICHCGKKAIMNMRIDESGRAVREGSQIEIGGNERYISTCRKHFRLGQSSKRTTVLS
ncbi:MAG: thymidine kinase [Proteobacteria bacterium]|nr:thymidine kinase [Pseudomonadota bacterium]